jgi:von Willebrand factor type A domain
VARLRRSLSAAGGCALFVLLLAPAIAAATRIHVDTETFPTLAVSVVLPHESSSPPRLFEDGRRVSLLYASNVGRASTVALAVDHSQSMHGQALRSAIAVAKRLLGDKRAKDRIAVFEIGSKAVQLTDFSRQTAAADRALDRISLDRHYGTALYDGVALASHALQREGGADRVLILVTDGQETTSTTTISDAAAVAADANVAVYPVAIKNLTYKPGTLDMPARATRGAFFGEATRSAATEYTAIANDIRRTWRLEYTTAGRPGDTVTLRVVDAGAPPIVTRVKIAGATGSSFLSRTLVLLLAFAVVAGVVLTVLLRATHRESPRSHSRPRQ